MSLSPFHPGGNGRSAEPEPESGDADDPLGDLAGLSAQAQAEDDQQGERDGDTDSEAEPEATSTPEAEPTPEPTPTPTPRSGPAHGPTSEPEPTAAVSELEHDTEADGEVMAPVARHGLADLLPRMARGALRD